MADLKDRLHTDLTAAMRARDELTTATLRMALAAVTEREVAGAVARQLDDEEVTAVLAQQAKRRREAAEAFDDAGRTELADRERAELAVLAGYLPQPLDDDELRALVAAAVADAAAAGATGPSAMGVVMRAAQQAAAGRADGKRLSTEVRAQLADG